MDNYTKKYFFGEIETLLDSRPVEELCPVLVYFNENKVPELLHWSGNKAVGDLLNLLDAIFK